MMPGQIKIRATVRAGNDEGRGEVRVLLPHPMESGLRHDAAGAPIPADFLTSLSLCINGRLVVEAGFGPSVSANPLLAFQFEEVRAGDRLSLAWRDNRGRHGSAEALFEAG